MAATGVSSAGPSVKGADGLNSGVISGVGTGIVGDATGTVCVGTLMPTVPPGTMVGLLDPTSQKYSL